MSDTWKNIKNIIGKSAPILGSAIVPGIGGVAGSLVAKMLGCDPNNPKTIEMQLKTDPKVALKLKELELKHEQFLITVAQENDKIYLNDIQNAREREIKYTKTTGEINYGLYILAGIITLGFIITIFVLFKVPIISVNKDIIVYAIGGIQGCFITVISYFFGSSKGSNEKNCLLTK